MLRLCNRLTMTPMDKMNRQDVEVAYRVLRLLSTEEYEELVRRIEERKRIRQQQTRERLALFVNHIQAKYCGLKEDRDDQPRSRRVEEGVSKTR